MRRIRQEIIIDLEQDEDPLDFNKASEAQIADRLVQFHYEKIEDGETPDFFLSPSKRREILTMLNFLLALDQDVDEELEQMEEKGCLGKRSQKQKRKA